MALALTDSSQNTNTITNNGADAYSADKPFSGAEQSASLVRSESDYLSIADDATLDITSTITLECWVYADSANNNQVLFWKGDDGGTQELNYVLDWGTGGKLRFYYWGTGYNIFTLTTGISSGAWTHIAFSYTFGTASSAQFYIDGSTSAGTWTFGTGNETVSANADALLIGAHTTGGTKGSFFDGKVDEVRIWDDIRTSGEISSNYNVVLSSPGSETNLQAYYQFGDAPVVATDNALAMCNF